MGNRQIRYCLICTCILYMTRKIKVLECIRQGQIGGGESHLLSLVQNLDRSEFEPIVLSFTDGPMIGKLREMDVNAQIIHTEKPFDIGKWGQVKQFIRNNNVDIIHAHGTRANSNIIWAARSLGIPVIYTIHGWSFHQDQNWLVKNIRIMGEKYLTNKSDLNISVSASNQQSGQKFISSFKSVVVNNGIDQQKFDPGKQYRDIRQELNIPKDKILVLFVARFTSHKQPISLIKAFQKAIEANPEMHLLMVGEGDERLAAEKIIVENRLENKITLQPFRQDVPDLLAAADIFVLPSLWEGLPIGLLEAMAMGKAVIASEVDGTVEIVQHNKNGFLIKTIDLVNELARSLLVLSQDAPLRDSFGREAIKTVKDRFNASVMTREIEKIYTTLYTKQIEKNKN